jgi:uncharacterized protein YjlB
MNRPSSVELQSRFAELLNPPQVETFFLNEDPLIPNSRLPLLIYRNAVKLPEEDPASLFEELFAENDWSNSWRDAIFPFHHYHSTTHEVLGVSSGSARVEFGGEHGIAQNISAGDVVVIPAGVAHKQLGASADFEIVGAYPGGRDWDMNYAKPGERPRADENIARVELPFTDPIYGEGGPLLQHWKK